MASLRVGVVDDLGLRGPQGDKGDPGDAGGGGVGPGVAAGGTAGQVLTKSDGTDFHTQWKSAAVPAGGSMGQVLKKTSGTDYAVGWAPETGGSGVPDGGTTGQVLSKLSGTDGDADWETPIALATTTPQALGTAAVGTGTSSARSNHVHAMPRLDQVLAPTADVDMNGQQITGGADGVADTDFATVGQVSDATTGLFDSAADVTTAIPGLTITVVYDDTLGWVLPTGFGTNANVAWVFVGGDESHAPPSTTSTRRIWHRPAS